MVIVTTIYLHRTSSVIPETFKFAGGRGALRRTWVMSEDQKIQVEWVIKALGAAFADESMIGLTKVVVDLADDGGSSYRITRNQDRTTYEKDGRPAQRDTLLVELRDAFEVLDGNREEFTSLFQSFKVKYDKNAYRARRILKDDPAAKEQRELNAEIRKLSQQLSKAFGPAWTPAVASKVEPSIFELVSRIKEVHHSIERLASKGEAPVVEHSLELGILREMQQILLELEGSGLPVSDIYSRKKAIEEELAELRSQNSELLSTPQNINWKDGFQYLGRMQVARRVAKILGDKREELSVHLQKPFELVSHEWNQILEMDTDLIRSLEKSLSLMTKNFYVASKVEEKRKAQTWFDRFKVQDQGKASEAVFELPEESLSELGQHTQKIIDALHLFREQSDQRNKKIFAFQETLDSLFEAYLNRSEELKREWRKFLSDSNLPKDLTLESFPRTMGVVCRLKALSFEAESIDRVMTVKKKAALRLSDLLTDWRKLTNSQKQATPNNVPMMIAEAQGCMRYLAKYERHLEENREQLEINTAHKILLANLIERRQELESEYSRSIAKLGVPPINGEQLLEHQELIYLVRNLTKKYDQAISDTFLSPMGFFGAYFNVWNLDSLEGVDEELGKIFKNSAQNCCHLVVVPSEKIALDLYTIGAGRILEIPTVESNHLSQSVLKSEMSPTISRGISRPQSNKSPQMEPVRTRSPGAPADQLMKTLEMLQGKRR